MTSWKVKKGPYVEKLTRALAEKWATMTRLPHDRELQKARTEHIRVILAKGTMRAPEWASCYCLETDLTYRVNGKHTSHELMIVEVLPQLNVIITEFEAETLEQVAELYNTFDARFSSKSPKDIYQVYAQANESIADLNAKILALSAVGMAYATWEEGAARKMPDERAKLLLHHPEFVLWLDNLLHGKTSVGTAKIRRGAVTAAMFKAWRKAPTKATEFWEEVRDASNPDTGSPSRVLEKWLERTCLLSGPIRGVNNRKKRASDHEMMVRCIHAWNAFRRGESTSLNYYYNKPTPDVV